MLRPNATDPGAVREIDQRHDHQRTEQQSTVDPGQNAQTAGQLNDRPPWVVQHAEHQIANRSGILPQHAGGSTRLQLLHAVHGQPNGMFKDLLSHRHLQQFRDPRGMPPPPDVDRDFEQ